MTVFGRGASAVFRDRELNVVGLKRKGVGDEGALSISDDSKASGRRFAEFLRECGTDLRALFLEVLEKVFGRSDRLSGALDVARTRGKEAFVQGEELLFGMSESRTNRGFLSLGTLGHPPEHRILCGRQKHFDAVAEDAPGVLPENEGGVGKERSLRFRHGAPEGGVAREKVVGQSRAKTHDRNVGEHHARFP